ncbi:MAG: hypothetical protein C4326_12345 [Ignavibacteria bacterium]
MQFVSPRRNLFCRTVLAGRSLSWHIRLGLHALRVLLFLFAIPARAQYPVLFDRISVEHGLVSNTATVVH